MDSSGFEAWDRQEIFFFSVMSRPGTGVAQLVEALCHKSEGRGFDPRYCHWNFSLRHSFRQNYGTEVDSDSNGNEYREYFLEGKGGRYRQLYQLCVPIASKSGSSNSWKPMGLYRDCPNFGIYHASPPHTNFISIYWTPPAHQINHGASVLCESLESPVIKDSGYSNMLVDKFIHSLHFMFEQFTYILISIKFSNTVLQLTVIR